MKHIVIIGGSGFIGSSLSRRLATTHRVTSISRSPLTKTNRCPGVTYVDITLDDHRQLRPLIEQADLIFYLASDTTPGSSRLQPSLEGINNLLPGLRFLELLQTVDMPRLVYLSSGGALYDPANTAASYDEDAPLNPLSYYGAGKIAMEQFIRAYAAQTGQPATILRPSNLYGPGQVEKKQFGIIPTLMNCALYDRPFTLWGDGETVRDFLYIDDFIDLCEAIIAEPAASGLRLYNAGSGSATSIRHLCEQLAGVTGKPLRIEQQISRKVDMSRTVLDCTRAKCDFDWQATTSLHEGLALSWRWYQTAQA